MKKVALLIFFIFIFSGLFKNISFAAIDYQLPYPGILPDSSFYKLKVARDFIVGFIISNPIKKAEFNLMQADKRLNAGLYLLKKDKNNLKLAESTISKGENYFFESLQSVKQAKKEGREVNDILRRLSLSSKKHQELLAVLRFNLMAEKSKDLEKEVNLLLQKEQE